MPTDSTATTIANSDAQDGRLPDAADFVVNLELALDVLDPGNALVEPRLKHAFQEFFGRGTEDEYLQLAPISFRQTADSGFSCAEAGDWQLSLCNARAVGEADAEAIDPTETAEDGRSESRYSSGSHDVGSLVYGGEATAQSPTHITAASSALASVGDEARGLVEPEEADFVILAVGSASINNDERPSKRKRPRERNSEVPDPKRVRLLVESFTEEIRPKPLLDELQKIMIGDLGQLQHESIPTPHELQQPVVTALRAVGRMWKTYLASQYKLNCVGRIVQMIIYHFYEYFMNSPSIPSKKTCGRGRKSYAYDILTEVTQESRESLEPLNSITTKLMSLVSLLGLGYILRISGKGSMHWKRNLRSVDFEEACESLFQAMKPENEPSRSDCDFLTARFFILLLKNSGFQGSEIVEMETSLTKVLRHHVDFTRLGEGVIVPNPDDPCRERRRIGRARPAKTARVHETETLTCFEQITTRSLGPMAENAIAVCPDSESSHNPVLAPSQLAGRISSNSVDGPFLGNQRILTLNEPQNENLETYHVSVSDFPPQRLPSHMEGYISIDSGGPVDSNHYQFSSSGENMTNLPQAEVPTGISYPVDYTIFDDMLVSSMELVGAFDMTSRSSGVPGFN